MGVVLGKLEEKKTYAIYYINEHLTTTELNYTMTEKEFLAIMDAINKFQHYINGYQVFVHIDHTAIQFLMNKPFANGRFT